MPPRRSPYALGIDIGNAKVKFCSLVLEHGETRMQSRSLPFDDRTRYRRHAGFETGLPARAAEFLGDSAGPPAAVAAVMSSGYAYPTYHEGVIHTVELLRRIFPDSPVFALSGTGSAVAAREILSGSRDVVGPVEFSNGMGAVAVALRSGALGEPANGLVLDTGGSTTAVTPVVDGAIDPAAMADSARHLDHRVRNGKLVWIGAQTTPLDALLHEALVGGRTYPVITRGVTFDNVSAILGLLPVEAARRLTLFGVVPDRALALRGIADSVNLDFDMASAGELEELAGSFRDAAVERLAAAISRAVETAPPGSMTRAAAFGIGAQGLAVPALVRAGFARENVILGEEIVPPERSQMASCFGACIVAAEQALGRTLRADLSDLRR